MRNIMPPVNTPDNVFHDGNPATGEKGTVVPGLWLTNVQDTIINTQQELASVLSAAGIAIDEAKKNQLATAISKLITDGGFLKTANNLSEIKAAGQAAVAQTLANLGLGEVIAAAADALKKSANLSDLTNKPAARTALELGNSATKNVGSIIGTVAAGNDPRFYSALQVQYNLDETNLNTLNKDKLGIYPQYTSALATADRNYPINFAGSLSVLPGGYGAIQEYTTYLYGLKYVRALIGDWNGNGPWGAWELIGNNTAPVGIPMPWPTETPPRGWLKCNGSAFDKALYSQLAVAYPSGFLPDLRGEFIRGLDDGRGIDSGRGLLSNQDSENKQHNHGVESENILHYSGNTGSSSFWLSRVGFFNKVSGISGGNESRPRNIAFNYIVRAA